MESDPSGSRPAPKRTDLITEVPRGAGRRARRAPQGCQVAALTLRREHCTTGLRMCKPAHGAGCWSTATGIRTRAPASQHRRARRAGDGCRRRRMPAASDRAARLDMTRRCIVCRAPIERAAATAPRTRAARHGRGGQSAKPCSPATATAASSAARQRPRSTTSWRSAPGEATGPPTCAPSAAATTRAAAISKDNPRQIPADVTPQCRCCLDAALLPAAIRPRSR